MIIDFHTHTFPKELESRVIPLLSKDTNMINRGAATNEGLKASMKEAGIDYSVLLPIATNPGQYTVINQIAEATNKIFSSEPISSGLISSEPISSGFFSSGLISFGSLHPENDNYKEILDTFAQRNIPGIKLHPVFQKENIDSKAFMNIIDYALSKNLLIVIHAGPDISSADTNPVSVKRLSNMLDSLDSPNIILAHMGGWMEWDLAEEKIVGRKVMLDTSFSIANVLFSDNKPHYYENEIISNPMLSYEQFVRIVKNHGSHKILFGSDYPWTSQKEGIEVLKALNLTSIELDNILGNNARRLLFKENK